MRGIFYSLVNTDNNTKVFAGRTEKQARELLAEAKSINPNANIIITYKWGNI